MVKKSVSEIKDRRDKVKTLMLKSMATSDIAARLKISTDAVLSDLEYWKGYYTKLATNNPYIIERQLAKVEQCIDEANVVKGEFWKLYEELKESMVKADGELTEWKKRRAMAEEEIKITEDEDEKRRLISVFREEFRYPPKARDYVTERLDVLKSVLTGLEKETKLLNLFNPNNLVGKEYIPIEVFKSVMQVFRSIIMDLIPEEQRKYAFERLKTIDVSATSYEEVAGKVEKKES